MNKYQWLSARAVGRPQGLVEDVPATVILVENNGGSHSGMVAALQHLGVRIGEVDTDPVATFLGNETGAEGLAGLVEANNNMGSPWGFDAGEAFRLLPSVIHLFQNPRVVITFRDPVATASESMAQLELVEGLTKASTENLALVEIVRALPTPSLLVSYEKARSDPADVISALADHCGIEPREGQRLRAIRAFQSSCDFYSPTTALWYEGFFEGVDTDNVARGWARRMPGNEPCLIEIFSGQSVVGRGLSNRPFEDDDHGQRGFAIEVVGSGSAELAARVAGTNTVLLSKTSAKRDMLSRSKMVARRESKGFTDEAAAATEPREDSSGEQMDHPWERAWKRTETLAELNGRIHDRQLDDSMLLERAEWLHRTALEDVFLLRPTSESRLLEVGGGVGWPAEAARRRYDCHVTDLDISPIMVARAKERLSALPDGQSILQALDFVVYDGVSMPFGDGSFDLVYSYATLWHIPPSHLAPILEGARRCLRQGASFVGQFMDAWRTPAGDWLIQSAMQRAGSEEHWHFVHTDEQLRWFFSQAGFGVVEIGRSATWFDGSKAHYVWVRAIKD